jgi:hypothetical protein
LLWQRALTPPSAHPIRAPNQAHDHEGRKQHQAREKDSDPLSPHLVGGRPLGKPDHQKESVNQEKQGDKGAFEWFCHGRTGVEQVIIQVWISTHFGVLSEQLPGADEHLLFIKATFTPAPVPM